MLPAAFAQTGQRHLRQRGVLRQHRAAAAVRLFDVESAKKPLLHLWSLGIEEQFYLFWPLILMLVARMRLRIVVVASVLGVASFVLNVALIGSNPVATFYLPFTAGLRIAGRRGAGLQVGPRQPERRGQQLARLGWHCADCGGFHCS